MRTELPIPEGRHIVRATCPACGHAALIAVELAAILTIEEGDTGHLRLRARTKPVAHDCAAASAAALPLDLGGGT